MYTQFSKRVYGVNASYLNMAIIQRVWPYPLLRAETNRGNAYARREGERAESRGIGGGVVPDRSHGQGGPDPSAEPRAEGQPFNTCQPENTQVI